MPGAAAHPPLPTADGNSRAFWDGVQAHSLLIQRCAACTKFQFPPAAACEHCGSAEPAFEEVSGRGVVLSFTETVSGARHPYFQAASPYLVGLVRLDEQEDLVLASNFPGARYDDLCIGAPVEVEFQEVAEGVCIPQFRLAADHEGVR